MSPQKPHPVRPVQCEWCEDPAVWCYVVKPEYRRFACDAHMEKTRQLVFLDRGPSVAYEVRRVMPSLGPSTQKDTP